MFFFLGGVHTHSAHAVELHFKPRHEQEEHEQYIKIRKKGEMVKVQQSGFPRFKAKKTVAQELHHPGN